MLKKITGTKLYEQVVEQIKNMIVQGIYQKGDLLPSEKELMEITGVSRITVREAMRVLSEVGIIETKQGKGSFVIIDPEQLGADASVEHTKEAYIKNFFTSTQARLLLEPEICCKAAMTATDVDIAAIEETLKSKKASIKDGELLEDFHLAIARCVKNEPLEAFLVSLQDLENMSKPALSLIQPEKQKLISVQVNLQHNKILQAIKNHDGEFAYFYMKEHLQYISDSYTEYFKFFY